MAGHRWVFNFAVDVVFCDILRVVVPDWTVSLAGYLHLMVLYYLLDLWLLLNFFAALIPCGHRNLLGNRISNCFCKRENLLTHGLVISVHAVPWQNSAGLSPRWLSSNDYPRRILDVVFRVEGHQILWHGVKRFDCSLGRSFLAIYRIILWMSWPFEVIKAFLVESLIPCILTLLLVCLIWRVTLVIELKIDRIVVARGFVLTSNLFN